MIRKSPIFKSEIFKLHLPLQRAFRNFRGFTLIELIVAFSIISILSTVGLASFVNYSNSQVVQGSTSDLMGMINVAKARAGSQTKPTDVGCSASTVLNGYGVKIDTVNRVYNLYADCSGNTYNIGKPQMLPKGITFEAYPQITTTNNIFFSVLTNGVQGTGFISLSGYNQSKCIIVNSAGVIQQVGSSCSLVSPTPAPQSWTVPAGTTSIYGAAGGNSSGQGNGGGATDVRKGGTVLSNRILVAGGGGGGGSSFISSSGTNTSTTSNVNTFFGQITITY